MNKKNLETPDQKPVKVIWHKNGNRIEDYGSNRFGKTSAINHKIMALGTVSMKQFLETFNQGEILYLKAGAEVQSQKDIDKEFSIYGVNFTHKEIDSLDVEHDSLVWDKTARHSKLKDDRINDILKTMSEMDIRDAAISKVIIKISDTDLGGEITNSYSNDNNYYSFLVEGDYPFVDESDTDFILKFSSYTYEGDLDLNKLLGVKKNGDREPLNGVQEENQELVKKEFFNRRVLHLDSMINVRQMKSLNKGERYPVVLTSFNNPFLATSETDLYDDGSYVDLVGKPEFRSRWDIVRHTGRHFESLNPYYKYYGTAESQKAELEGVTEVNDDGNGS